MKLPKFLTGTFLNANIFRGYTQILNFTPKRYKMEENQKIAQIRKLKRMNKKLLNIVPLIEKKVGQKLKLLHNNSFYDRCEEYVDEKVCGISNFYYEWFKESNSTIVDFMYGVELMNNNFYFVFDKCNIIVQDEVKKFLNFQDFLDFLKSRGKLS